jgi:ferrochelatase
VKADPPRTSVVLLNMGGPDSEAAIQPFLHNLFSDPEILSFPLAGLVRPFLARAIAARRAPRVLPNYRAIGGKSPLREISEAQAAALQTELGGAAAGIAVHVAMRYWHPFAAEAAGAIRAWNPARLVVLPLYPHYCRATTGSSLRDLEAALAAAGLGAVPRTVVGDYPDYAPYVDALAETVREGLERLPGATVLYSAHGLPQKIIDRGDPYLDHVQRTVAALAQRLPDVPWRLAFQSRVGPVKWLEPALGNELAALAGEGVRNLVVVPISFVSDHIETLHELDIEYREAAAGLGITGYVRAAALNTRPAFIAALAQRVRQVLGDPEIPGAPSSPP